jgi:signal transduction histidine kinase
MSVQLENLRTGEKVDIVLRRHWIAFVFLGIYALWGVILTFILIGTLWLVASCVLILSIFWMYYLLFLYVNWINYELDVFILTNNRIVCVEQKTFLNRAVWETTLDKVQEVSIETKWLLANLFDFGTLKIMTSWSSPSFDMTFSPHPMKSSRYINNLVDRYRDSLYGWGSTEQKMEKLWQVESMQTEERARIMWKEGIDIEV